MPTIALTSAIEKVNQLLGRQDETGPDAMYMLARKGGYSIAKARKLPVFVEAQRLQPIGLGTDGRDKLLVSGAATAWGAMSTPWRLSSRMRLRAAGVRA